MRARVLLAVLIGCWLAAVSTRASALPPPAPEDQARWRWDPTEVHYPVPSGDPQRTIAAIERAPARVGPVRVDAAHGAFVWLRPLESVRVRGLESDATELGLVVRRLEVRPEGGWVWIEVDPPRTERGHALLVQPPAAAGGWMIGAKRPLDIHIERPGAPDSVMLWEWIEDAIVDWIAGKSSWPILPAREGVDAMATEIRAQEQLAEAVSRYPSRDRGAASAALQAWRTIAALRTMAIVRPLGAPHHANRWFERRLAGTEGKVSIAPPGAGVARERPYRQFSGAKRWTVKLLGPGTLVVRTRALVPRNAQAEAAKLSAVVRVQGRELGRFEHPIRAGRVIDPVRSTAVDPVWTDLETTTGTPVSLAHELVVPLLVGRHEYEIEVDGAQTLIKALAARRVHRLETAVRGRTIRGQARRAAKHLRRTGDPIAAFVTYLIASELTGASGPVPELPEVPAAASERALVSAWRSYLQAGRDDLEPRRRLEQAERTLKVLAGRSLAEPDDAELHLRFEVARIFAELGRPGHAFDALRARARWLNGDALVLLAELAPEPGTAIEALDLAAPSAPLLESTRVAYMQLWGHSRFERLEAQGEAVAWTWIHRLDPTAWGDEAGEIDDATGLRSSAAGLLWELPASGVSEIFAPPARFEPARRAVVRVHFVDLPTAGRPVGLEVGGTAVHTLALEKTETIAVAVNPGQLNVQARGGAAFVSVPTLQGGKPRPPSARKARLWSLRGVDPVRFAIEPSDSGSLLRVTLRAVMTHDPKAHPTRARLRVVTDRGTTAVFEVGFKAVDPSMIPLDAPGAVSAPVSFVIPVEAGVRKVWLSGPAGLNLVGVMSQRRAFVATPAFTPERRPGKRPGDEYWWAKVEAMSRRLVAEPDDVGARVTRAERLLDLSETSAARRDLEIAKEIAERHDDDAERSRVERAIARLEAFSHGDHLDLRIDRDAPPVVLDPPMAVVVGAERERLERWTPFIERVHPLPVRERLDALRAEPGLDLDLDPVDAHIAATLRASWVEQLRQPKWAAVLWTQLAEQTGHWQLALRATESFLAAFEGPRPERVPQASSLAFGVAQSLDRWIEHTDVRRLRAITASSSQWQRISQLDARGGTARIEVGRRAEPLGSFARLREALVVPPWPHEQAQLIRAGGKARLEGAIGEGVAVDVWCQHLDASEPKGERVPLELSIGEQEPIAIAVDHAQVATHVVPSTGSQAVERVVTLSAEAQDYACSVRWRRARAAEPIAHDHVFIDRASSRWTAVAPGRPASLAVLGPTVLRIEARAADPGPGRTLTIRARSRSGTQTVQTFELSQRPDLMVRSASEQRVGIAIEALVNLAHAEPYQLTLETPEGRTFVRATMREDRAGEVPAAPRSLVEGPELQPVWPWRAPALPAQDDRVAAAPRVGGGGSISAVVTIGRDDITDADDFRPRNRTGLAIGWRRALGGNAWLRTQASLLGRERSGIAGGAEVLLAGVIPKAEVRGSIGTQWMAERFAGDAAWSARATGLVDRPIALAPLWRLIPRFVVAYRYQSLTEAEVDAVDEGVHPEVYTEYVEQHPWALSPEMIVRWRPFQNARVSASAGVTTNGDFQDLDHADLSVQWAAVLPSSVHIVPEYDIGYQSSFRFADEHRGAFFVRHRLSAGLGASFWVSDLGRLMIGGREVVYMSRPWPTRNAFEVWFGFEFGLGRGVTDYSPLEQRFRAFYEGRR